MLEESGDWAGDPFTPYRRLEAHATTGQALLVTAVPDDDFRTCQHDVRASCRVDLDTGRVERSRRPPRGAPVPTPDCGRPRGAGDQLRERLSALAA